MTLLRIVVIGLAVLGAGSALAQDRPVDTMQLRRLLALIESYAADYRGDTLTDAKAERLLAEALAIEEAEVALKKAYVPRLRQALPAIKVARYIQIENKIRAVLKYDLATQIPLAR